MGREAADCEKIGLRPLLLPRLQSVFNLEPSHSGRPAATPVGPDLPTAFTTPSPSCLDTCYGHGDAKRMRSANHDNPIWVFLCPAQATLAWTSTHALRH